MKQKEAWERNENSKGRMERRLQMLELNIQGTWETFESYFLR